MSSESVEVQLARMDERWKTVSEALVASAASRRHQYDCSEELKTKLTQIDTRLQNVETQVATAQPTIQEFITIKHKVVGAGAAGKWLWAALAAILGLIVGGREAIFHFFSKGS